MKRPLVSIIIVNWNEREMLRNCLNSIQENTTYPNYNVVVVDNGSTDASAEMVKKEFPHVKLIQNRENLGFSKANNQAIKAFESDYYLLLNNDTEVTKDWLTKMIKVSESGPKIGIVGCKLLSHSGGIQHAGGWIALQGVGHYVYEGLDELGEVDFVTGAVFLIKKKVVNQIGLLDEGFSPFTYEDIDYCVRARKAGYKTMYDPKTIVIHYTGYSLQKQAIPFVYFVKEKNRLRFMWLNFPLSWLVLRIPYEIRKFITTSLGVYGSPIRILPLLAKAWLVNLRMFKEILEKRNNRTMKL